MKRLQLLLFVSVLAGLVVGTLNSVVQQVTTVPLIMEAETYENAMEPVATASHAENPAGHASYGHHHDAGAWQPEDGSERTLYTLLANILIATGFAFVVTGLLSMKSVSVGALEGICWGLAGFVIVSLAPSLGLPPELPGTAAADLDLRQTWWIGTVVATASGIGLLYLRRELWVVAPALLLLAAPHLIGAPHPGLDARSDLAPRELEVRFIFSALVMSLISWLFLVQVCRLLLNKTMFAAR